MGARSHSSTQPLSTQDPLPSLPTPTVELSLPPLAPRMPTSPLRTLTLLSSRRTPAPLTSPSATLSAPITSARTKSVPPSRRPPPFSSPRQRNKRLTVLLY